MDTDHTEKLVAATLAAAVIALEKPSKPIESVLIYERILRVMVRRAAKAEKIPHETDDAD